ncbi:decoy of host sigma32 [Salmonella phage vB_SnwM_CGG4-1]|uniref:Postulated decoy of sigma32 n=1 Tax=Salmonella phage vB_SnwM_CGG4-1 TaxID=1815631 RepID=A0A1B0VV97_9CAUD|nr:decoy of host sigma32 [Salmonella phage vB_SnwM_CGG4-1]ANA49375.1 postulated decoy of sigma32 [Salmonella phage vB_SnwM_CGG4-1]
MIKRWYKEFKNWFETPTHLDDSWVAKVEQELQYEAEEYARNWCNEQEAKRISTEAKKLLTNIYSDKS